MSHPVPGDTAPIDFRTKPPKLTAVTTTWRAWWEDNDMWDGAVQYADLDAAKHHAAVDYIGEEHCWLPGDDPADEAPDVTLTWAFEHQMWHLLSDGKNTGVRLHKTCTYARDAGHGPEVVGGHLTGEPTIEKVRAQREAQDAAAALRQAADLAHAEGTRLYNDMGQKAAAGAWAVRDRLRARGRRDQRAQRPGGR